MSIRNSAKAIIIHKNKVLVNKCRTEKNEIYYDLPGGGQNKYETMEEAAVREVLEETGYKIKIVRYAALAEEIYDDIELRKIHSEYSHKIVNIFLGELLDENHVEIKEKDYQQEESLWISFSEINGVVFRPEQLTGRIMDIIEGSAPKYLGSIRMP